VTDVADIGSRAADSEPALVQLADFLDQIRAADQLDLRLELALPSAAAQRAADALNALLDKLWIEGFELTAKREMLEKVIEIRTLEVREILDHVAIGFLLTNKDGAILPNYSRACVGIFGLPDLAGRRLADLLTDDVRQRETFELLHRQAFDEILPPEVALAQLPAELRLGDRTYSLQGAPILGQDGAVARVFFTVADTTDLRRLEAANTLNRTLIEIARMGDAFRYFVDETARSFAAARISPTQLGFRSLLHTLKGNLGCFGLHELAAQVHAAEEASEITLAQLGQLEDALTAFVREHEALLGTRDRAGLDRDGRRRLGQTLDAIVALEGPAARRAAADELLRTLDWIRVGATLAPLRGIVDRLAQRLDKQVALELRGEEVRIDPQRLAAVLGNVGHLVRNAIDHGLEPVAARGAKAPTGTVVVVCEMTEDGWVISVSDDGRGVDLAAVTAAAIAAGHVTADELAAMPASERMALVFFAGLTTKAEVSLVSGRGIGLTAFRDSVVDLGGVVTIDSAPGVGTTVSARIPFAADDRSPSRSSAPGVARAGARRERPERSDGNGRGAAPALQSAR
jgi:signal transduction histidine kinase